MIADPREIDPREIQRLRFQPGQDLLSRDFRDGAAFDLSLREWHNRALHQAFGVASGLGARPVPDSGAPTAVEVSAGLAYDCTGRALFLTAAALVPVPSPWPGGPQLLVLGGDPEALTWVSEAGWRPSLGVPLARLRDDKGKAQWDGEFSQPRARALARQRIASGSTVEGATAWQRWFGPSLKGLQGIEVQVNTSAAGFRHTPCYFAWVEGSIQERPSTVLVRPLGPLHLFSHLTEARPSGFRFRVAAPFDASLRDRDSSVPIFPPFDVLIGARRSLAVCWIGIEMDEIPKSEPEPEVPDGKP